MRKKEYCFNCDKDVIPKKKIENNIYKINGENFEIEELVYVCSSCGNEIDVEEYDQLRNIYIEYLKRYDLTLDDFKNIRKKYNLSQESFSKILGWAKKTVARYEKEASFPQKEYLDTYKKLKNSKTEMLKIMDYNKERLGKEYYYLLKQMGLYEHLKTVNSFLYMLDKNNLYSTSLMKNMFALDFEYNKLFNKPLTTLSYAKAPFGPIINNHDEIINYLLNEGYLGITTNDIEKFMFIAKIECDNNFFNNEEMALMKRVKNKLKGKSATELSNWSHEFLGWKETPNGKIIDYKKYRNDFNLETI